MRPSESRYFDVRGLRYHVRCWPASGAPKVVLLHGWMDVSASFQFFVDALRGTWDVLAPDWRGYGLTDWGREDCYWFPDYLADLDALLAQISPDHAVHLVGHSLGGNVACLYAGVRAERVAKLVNLEGLGLTGTRAEKAPGRYARWLAELREKPAFRDYENFEALAERLRGNNSRLSGEKAAFLARHWGRSKPDGRVELASDPAHKLVNPVLYRVEEAEACWRKAAAPVLWVVGAESNAVEFLKLSPQDLAARKSCFQRLTERVIPEAGHMLHHDQPERLAAVIEEFLG